MSTRCRFCGVPIKVCDCDANYGRPHWQTEWEPLGQGVTFCAPDWKRMHEPGVTTRDLEPLTGGAK